MQGNNRREVLSASANPGRMVRRRVRTRRALMDAAETLFASQGVEGVSIDEIANLADVAKGTFYNYFADKDALAREVSEATRSDLEGEITELNASIDDAALRVARAFCVVLRFGLAHPDRARTMMRMHPHATDPEAPLNAGVLSDGRLGRVTGRFAVPSDEMATILIVGVVQAGLSRALDLLDPVAVARLGAGLAVLLLRGLGLDDEEASRLVASAVDAVFAEPDLVSV